MSLGEAVVGRKVARAAELKQPVRRSGLFVALFKNSIQKLFLKALIKAPIEPD